MTSRFPSFKTFLRTDPSLSSISVFVNRHFPVGKKMVETKHSQRVSIPQECSQRYTWAETMEVPLNHLSWELHCSETERQIKPSMRKKLDLILFHL